MKHVWLPGLHFSRNSRGQTDASASIILNISTTAPPVSKAGITSEHFGMRGMATVSATKTPPAANCLPSKYCFSYQRPREQKYRGASQEEKFYRKKKHPPPGGSADFLWQFRRIKCESEKDQTDHTHKINTTPYNSPPLKWKKLKCTSDDDMSNQNLSVSFYWVPNLWLNKAREYIRQRL